MAYIITHKWTEEAWGRPVDMHEHELITDENEVADLLVERINDEGIENVLVGSVTVFTVDDYSEEEIEIDCGDWLDIDSLYEWHESFTDEEFEKEFVTNGEEHIPEEILYARLGVLSPRARK